MLNPAKPVGDCSPQELVAALTLKAAFNQFDPKQVLSDLYEVEPKNWTGE